MRITRREMLAALGTASSLSAAKSKPMRGAFIIMATPFTESKAVDYEDLANEVKFLHRCGVHGMVWPQMASEYATLTKEERLRGMEVLVKAAKRKKPALVLGVQGANTDEALVFLRHAEKLGPDAVISMPPTEAKNLDDYRRYYGTLARETKRPFFIQTTGGAKGVTPTVEFLVELAKEYPHLGYIKEETPPVIRRLKQMAAHRPVIKSLFSGAAGREMMFEMRLGFDGTMPGAPYADFYAQIWDSFQGGRKERAREIFSKLLLLINIEQQIQGTRPYVMKKRGVFKTTVSRRNPATVPPEGMAEIDAILDLAKPYLRV